MTPEPIFDLAHLGHMELLTPKPDESLKFFVDVMGHDDQRPAGRVRLSSRLGRLRALFAETDCVEDLRHGAHGAARAQPAGAGAPCRALKGSGFEVGWIDGDMGRGRRSAAATRTGMSSNSITRPNGIRRPPS